MVGAAHNGGIQAKQHSPVCPKHPSV